MESCVLSGDKISIRKAVRKRSTSDHIRRVWATSDWHLGHAKIREYCKSRAIDHECMILQNYLDEVRPQDTVYFLGDMVLRWGEEGRAWWNQIRLLPGRKVLVKGNHDQYSTEKLLRLGGFEQVWPEFFGLTTSIGHKLLLSHVPMVVTPFDDRYNGWRRRVQEEFVRGQYDLNIHGHTHEQNTGDSQCVNVSVENTEFKPALLDEMEV